MRDHQEEYTANEQPRFVETKPGKFLTITGRSDPGSDEMHERARALYKAVGAIEDIRRHAGKDFAISTLEALWWQNNKGEWHWKLMIRVPDNVAEQDLASAKKTVRRSLLDDVWLENIDEGRVVQVLHTGPFEREQESVDRMHQFARDHGFMFDGFHHEIYLTNPTEVPPDRLRTILRHRVIPATAAPLVH